MSAICRWIKPNRSRPGMNDPRILPSRQVRRRRHTARKEELLRLQAGGRDPGTDRVPRLFGDLELHRPLGLLLHDDRTWGNMTDATPAPSAFSRTKSNCEGRRKVPFEPRHLL